MTFPRCAFVAALLVTGGCAGRDTVAAAPRRAVPAFATPLPDLAPFCGGSGPTVLLDGTCTGALAQRAFARAACACGALALGGDLVTDGFDSRSAPWSPGGAGADVGVEGGLSFQSLLQVGGSLVVSGGGVQAGSTLRVGGDLAAAGSLGQPRSVVTVGGSARVAGDVSVASLSVGGTLTTPPGASVGAGALSAGATAQAAVSVAPACPCGAAQGVDVAAIVPQYATTNDNASAGLAADALSLAGAGATLTLPCGRFYLDRIQGERVTLRATGRAALFVGGGITLSGALAIELDPGAELDLFVTGPVNLPASLALGDPTRPSALRLWISSGGAISLPDGTRWAANLYAPAADLSVSTPVELYGAVTVLHLLNAAPVTIHYDRAIASAAAACTP